MIQILPGILEKNFDEIVKKVEQVKDLVDWVHVDVLDNTLIKNVTYNEFPAFKQFIHVVNLEAHLMVARPEKYVAQMALAGFSRLIAHAESESVREFIAEARVHHVEVGVALDGPSDLELVEPYLDQVDTVLIMMYKAGASGQPFQPENLQKIKAIASEYHELPIEVDGGISRENAPSVIEAGATRLVSTSYLFWKNKDRIAEAIEELRG